MHDVLYEHQRPSATPTCSATPRSSASTSTASTPTWQHTRTAERVREDFMSGVRSGVNGTPSFYINGARYDDSYDLETLVAALEDAAG